MTANNQNFFFMIFPDFSFPEAVAALPPRRLFLEGGTERLEAALST